MEVPVQVQVELVQNAGYSHVLLVGERFTYRNERVHPRFTMHGTSSKELRFRATGGLAPVTDI